MTSLKNQRGQAILEALIVFKVFIVLMAAVLSLSGLLFHKHWVLYNTQKALVCFAEGKGKTECLFSLKKRLSASFFKSKVEVVKSDNGHGVIRVTGELLNQKLVHVRELLWPARSIL